MKTIYFIINYFMMFLSTAIFGFQIKELYLKPVRIKKDERPHNRGMRTEDYRQIGLKIN